MSGQPAYNKQRPETIRKMFGSIATGYDRGNAILSFMLLKIWNRRLIKETLTTERPADYLDLCAGTGDIALAYLKECTEPVNATLLDFTPEMLVIAEKKAAKLKLTHHTVSYVEGDAMQLPMAKESFDAVTVAYGIRNIKNPQRAIAEAFRVLRPEGCFGILELTRPENAFLRAGHSLYLKTVLPVLGRMVAKDKAAYKYLCESIHSFVPVSNLTHWMRSSGFRDVRAIPLFGGIATVIVGRK